MSTTQQQTHGDNSPIVGGNYTFDARSYHITNIPQLPSFIGDIISSLIPSLWNIDLEDRLLANDFAIQQKISYNSVVVYKPIILELGRYEYIIQEQLQKLESTIPGLRNRFLKFANGEYLKLKPIENLTSDNILERIIGIFVSHYISSLSPSSEDVINREDLINASEYLVCWCFVQCKILEVPVQ